MCKNIIHKMIYLLIAIPLLCTALTPIISYADTTRTPEYQTPGGTALDDMFELNTEDIKEPYHWITHRKTYPVIEKSDYGNQLWMNVPNLQLLVIGKIDGIIANGYTDGGEDVDAVSKGTTFETDFNHGKSGMSKFGFNIPNPTYKGEYPVISYDFSSVLPDGVWGTIKSAVRGLFGGSFIDPPSSAEDYASLRYVNLTDYKEDYAMCTWIRLHWNATCKKLEKDGDMGQVLLPKKITGNNEGKIDGVSYTYENVIKNNNLNKVEGSVVEFNRKLKTIFGQYYYPIMCCMVGLEPKHRESVLTNFTLRQMPYDLTNMGDTGEITVNLVNDPRCDIGLFYQTLHYTDQNSGYHGFAKGFVGLQGDLAKFTRYLNTFTDFSVLESLGVKFDILWQPDILKNLVTLFAIFVTILACKYGIQVAKGSMGTIEGIYKVAASVILAIILYAIAITPHNAYDLFKSLAGFGDNLAASTMNTTEAANYMNDDVDLDEKYEMAYWVPYFEIWSYYNTSHSMSDNEINTANAAKEPEQDEMNLPKINGKEKKRWNILLASSFCDGYQVKRNAYRVVDHFLAPRMSFDFDGKTISSKANENYTDDIQTKIGANWMIVFDVFICQIVKVLFFFNLCFEFMFIFLFIIFKYRDYGVKDTLKGFGAALIEYWATGFIIPVVACFTFICNSQIVPCITVTFVLGIYLFAFFKLILRGPSWMQPKAIRLILNKGRRI